MLSLIFSTVEILVHHIAAHSKYKLICVRVLTPPTYSMKIKKSSTNCHHRYLEVACPYLALRRFIGRSNHPVIHGLITIALVWVNVL